MAIITTTKLYFKNMYVNYIFYYIYDNINVKLFLYFLL